MNHLMVFWFKTYLKLIKPKTNQYQKTRLEEINRLGMR
jgi:hypothetical protein